MSPQKKKKKSLESSVSSVKNSRQPLQGISIIALEPRFPKKMFSFFTPELKNTSETGRKKKTALHIFFSLFRFRCCRSDFRCLHLPSMQAPPPSNAPSRVSCFHSGRSGVGSAGFGGRLAKSGMGIWVLNTGPIGLTSFLRG